MSRLSVDRHYYIVSTVATSTMWKNWTGDEAPKALKPRRRRRQGWGNGRSPANVPPGRGKQAEKRDVPAKTGRVATLIVSRCD